VGSEVVRVLRQAKGCEGGAVEGQRVSTVMPFLQWELTGSSVPLDDHTTLYQLHESPLVSLLDRLADEELFRIHGWPGSGAVVDSPWFPARDLGTSMPGWDRNWLAMALLGISCDSAPHWTQTLYSADNYETLTRVEETPADWERPQVILLDAEDHQQPVCNEGTLAFMMQAWRRLLSTPGGACYSNRVYRAICYYVSAFRARFDEEAIVSLAIGLETLFAPHSHAEVSVQVATNACRFLGEDVPRRKEVFGAAKSLYTFRSAIVHGATPSSLERQAKANAGGYRLLAGALRRILGPDSGDLFAIFSNETSRRDYLQAQYFT
jgi:hypothetical protein